MLRKPVLAVIQRWLRSLIIGLSIVYTFGLTGLVIAWSQGTAVSWPLAMTNIFALYFFLPLLPLLLLAPFLRSRSHWLALAVSGALFLLLFGAHLLPPDVPTATGPRLRILTVNVLFNNQRYSEVVQFVYSTDADIVALQELAPDMASALQTGLADRYPYYQFVPSDGANGFGILSRYPLHEVGANNNPHLQEVLLDLNGQPLRMVNVHPRAPQIEVRRIKNLPITSLLPDNRKGVPMIDDFSTEERDATLTALVQQLDGLAGPLIVAGDFNLTDREAPYRALDQRLDDAFAHAGWGFGNTFPSPKTSASIGGQDMRLPLALVRIDYVWSSADLPAHSAEVRCDVPGADHCAVIADLVVEQDHPDEQSVGALHN